LGQGIDQEGIQADLPSRRRAAHAAVQFDGQPADDLDGRDAPDTARLGRLSAMRELIGGEYGRTEYLGGTRIW